MTIMALQQLPRRNTSEFLGQSESCVMKPKLSKSQNNGRQRDAVANARDETKARATATDATAIDNTAYTAMSTTSSITTTHSIRQTA